MGNFILILALNTILYTCASVHNFPFPDAYIKLKLDLDYSDFTWQITVTSSGD